MVGLRKLCKGDLPPVSEQKTNHKTPGNITYTQENGARKTFQITVRPDGTVSVKAPRFMKESDVKRLVECRETWIQEKLAGFPAVPPLPTRPPLGDGSRVPFLGEVIRLDVADGRGNSARLDGKILRVTTENRILAGRNRESAQENVLGGGEKGIPTAWTSSLCSFSMLLPLSDPYSAHGGAVTRGKAELPTLCSSRHPVLHSM